MDLKQEIRQVIGAVEDPILQTLLELQYLSFRSWPEIIQTMGYSRSTIWRFRKAALEAVKVPESCKIQKVGTV